MKLDFVVIGASRSGTTWIHDNINTHPEIVLPSKVGEPHFFSKYFDQGFDYYESLFEEDTHGKTVGEVTPDYIYSDQAPDRIKQYAPNVKLILSVRNPTDRLYSMYWILRGKYEQENQHSFEDKLERQPDLIDQGYYMNYINRYLSAFSKEQLLVLQFDELKSNPESYLRKIYDFIGVDANVKSPYAHTKINRATFRKHYSKSKLLFLFWRVLKKLRLNKWAYKIEKTNSKKTPEMNPATRKKLVEIYKPYNDQLAEFLGVDLAHWNK